MYRILVVDDEDFIVDWICELIETESGLEADVYRAYSAPDALKLLQKAKVDILITDICMPLMDGLSLLDRVNQVWPCCKVILITGYAEFDYAYYAIRNHAAGYVLKTEEDEKILSEVKKAAALVDAELRNTEMIRAAEGQAKEAARIIARDWFHTLLRGEWERLSDMNDGYDAGIPLLDLRKPFYLILGRADIRETCTPYESFRKIRQVEGIADYFLSQRVISIPVEYSELKLLWFIQPKEEDAAPPPPDLPENAQEQTAAFIMGMLESVQRSCRETLGTALSLVVGNAPVKTSEFAERFDCLEQLLNFHTADKEEVLLSDRGVTGRSEGLAMPYSDLDKVRLKLMKTDALESFLENGQRKEFTESLSEICECLRSVRNRNSSIANEIYYRLALMFLSYINRRNMAEAIASRLPISRLTRADDHATWDEAAEYLCRLTETIFELNKKDREQAAVDLVEYIRGYVETHIGEDVSLVKLAEVTGYNPAYLSRFYKNNSLENLYDYISRVRVEKAKLLLKDTEASLNDISSQVGFNSRSCFNRFFKRLVGTTPQEYREASKAG